MCGGWCGWNARVCGYVIAQLLYSRGHEKDYFSLDDTLYNAAYKQASV